MLSAWSLGVGSVCLGSPIRFLTDNDLCLCIGLGYADESPETKTRDMGKVKFGNRRS